MKRRVIAIGLDSTGSECINQLFAQGHLPRIAQLRQQSSQCRLETKIDYWSGSAGYASTEGNWVMFQTGVSPRKSGYWETVTYDRDTYRTTNDFFQGGYDYKEFKPFYALGAGHHVAAFDVPVSAVLPKFYGQQIVGWGGHFPYVVRGSNPAGLFDTTNRRFGKNPVIYRDHGVLWSQRYARWLEQSVIRAMEQRREICLDLMNHPDLDLMVAVLGETHSVLHDLWADSHADHPAHGARTGHEDAFGRCFEAVDRAVGAILDRLRPEDYFVLFSVHDMQANSTDLACLFFLSEMLYRLNFTGRCGLAFSPASEPVPPVVLSGLHWYWFGEIWRRKAGRLGWARKWLEKLPAWSRWNWPGGDLRFPFFMSLKGAENGWMPVTWYRPSWPRSRSFAIPAFADGHVRINVRGREKQGIVEPQDYERECETVRKYLAQWTNPRTGRPVVVDVLRTRGDALDPDPTLPHADLVVVWTDEPFDVLDHPQTGRIGPVSYFRTGGHRPGGFAMIKGVGIAPGETLPPSEVYDLAPTILDLLNVPVPKHFEGQSILNRLPKSV